MTNESVGSTADKALKALAEAEDLRKTAIDELVKQREDINRKLAELGYASMRQAKNVKPGKKPCKVCGSFEHDGRFHRGETLKKKKKAGAK